jgi:type II secretion system protein G
MFQKLMKKFKKNNKGFTLVELLVVIAITGVLGAVAVPTVFGSTEKANVSAVVSDYNAIKSAVLGYNNDKATLPEGVEAKTETVDDKEVTTPEKSALQVLQADKYLDRIPQSPFGDYVLDTTSNTAKLIITEVSESSSKILVEKLGSIVTEDDGTVTITIVTAPTGN